MSYASKSFVDLGAIHTICFHMNVQIDRDRGLLTIRLLPHIKLVPGRTTAPSLAFAAGSRLFPVVWQLVWVAGLEPARLCRYGSDHDASTYCRHLE